MKYKSILITGGTGSLGNAIVKRLLKKKFTLKRLVIFSRDELKQSQMMEKFPPDKFPMLRFFLGDVRDKDRLKRAFSEIDLVIHAAALKQVPAAEYNPIEFIKTNITGASNVIEAAIDSNVKKVVALSTDKACAPLNLYGATKLCSDKLFIAANNFSGKKIIFSVVRYGNVMNSRGSVLPIFLKQKKSQFFTITDPEMTRFNITLDESVNLVLKVCDQSVGFEIFVPKIPSFKIVDLAKAVSSSNRLKFIGTRPGEKIHEEMITEADSKNVVELKDSFVVCPREEKKIVRHYVHKLNGKILNRTFSYNSKDNPNFLSVNELKELISKIN
jgi:UDP-N-acetylglucosamine 4,6-dehydratase